MLPFILKGSIFPSWYKKKIPLPLGGLCCCQGKQPVHTAQRGDLIRREISKNLSSEAPLQLPYCSWEKKKKKAVLPKEYETLVLVPAKAGVTPSPRNLSSQHPRVQCACQTGSLMHRKKPKVRDSLKTASCEEWETSLWVEQLSSSLYC